MLRKELRLMVAALVCLTLIWAGLSAFFPAKARFQNNPQQVTLIDVLACLTLFQNPGQTLSAQQIATGVGAILGQTIPAESFNPVPTVAECDFVAGSPTGVDLADVIALLVAFQNPGVALSSTQIASGVNAILGTTLTDSDVLIVPNNSGIPTPTPNNSITVPGTVNNQLVTGDPMNPFRPGRFYKDFTLVGAVAGQRLQIDMSSTQLDTVLQIVNLATSTVLLENDDLAQGNTNSRVILIVEPGVTYTVRATSFNPNETGAFTLSTQLLLPPTPTPSPTPIPTPGQFTITLEFVDNLMSASQQQTLRNAAHRWEQLITGDLGNYVVTSNLAVGFCSGASGGVPIPSSSFPLSVGRVINDVLIQVRVGLLGSTTGSDGQGNTLANAGPCGFFRSGLRLQPFGGAGFDPADLNNPLLLELAIHEFGHVLGIGTLWESRNGFPTFISGNRYIGPVGRIEFQAYGGQGDPLVQQPTPGHWDEDAFGVELMTPFLNGGRSNPLSRVTLGALQDLGYSGLVFAAADTYALGERAGLPDDVNLGDDIYIGPTVTPEPNR